MSTRWFPRSLCVILAWLSLTLLADRSVARAKYKTVFVKTYPKVEEQNKVDCKLCHFGESRKNRNHYGEALAKELGEKNVMDEEKIKKALKAIEDGDCKTGKWKQRLQEGQWPCTCETNKHDSESYISRLLGRGRTE